ncbi:MAG: ABC transporter ATP-binding protein [Marinibacterium sp.]
MTAVLEVSGLNKAFGGIRATDDVNLRVAAGELHAIIGPNGAGKTTLVSQLSGLQFPDSGTIRFQGRDITRLAAPARARLGIARSFQITSLIMDMSAADNVALAVQARDGSSFRFIRAARKIRHLRAPAEDLLAQVGLGEKADLPARALSHGEHRKLEIAMALAARAELLLLDEPMAGLGPESSGQMIDLLRSIKGDRSILLIEHDMDAVFALADRISVVVYGHVIATGTPDEIRRNDAVRHAYLGEETAC